MKSLALISDHASPLADLGGVDSGGQNVYVKQVASHLAARGYDVDVFTRRDNPDLPEVITCENGVRVVHITAGPPEFIRKEELLQYMDEFSANTVKFCSRRSYDIIHANFWMSGLVALQVKRLLRIPFVITFHALGRIRRLYQNEADRFPDERFSIEDTIISECDGVIAECPQDRADLIDFYQADSARICIVPCGVDPLEIYPVAKSVARGILGFDRDAPLILQLGRIVPRKGIDTVIRGFARFLKKSGLNARLAVVGGATRKADPDRDPEIRRLQTVAQREGVTGEVIFAGRAERDEVKYYFSAADVFVTTPWYEPFGITPIEAMACGTPVIGASVGGIKYTVKDSVTGLLVPPNSAVGVSEALLQLYSARGLLDAMRKNAIDRVNKLFTWEIVVQKLLRFYKKVAVRSAPFASLNVAVTPAVPAGDQEKENDLCNRWKEK